MMKKVQVLLADDHALFREGLAGIVASQPDMEIVGEANDGIEAFVKAQEIKPDLILMDVQMPGVDGLDATREIKQVLPNTIIVMLTVHDNDEEMFRALKNGAQGYLLKEISSQGMLAMLRGAMAGEVVLSPALAGRVLKEFRRLCQCGLVNPEDINELTEREQQVLFKVAKGATDKEIAEALTISLYTVKSHIRNILFKLHTSSRREAARMARNKGLI